MLVVASTSVGITVSNSREQKGFNTASLYSQASEKNILVTGQRVIHNGIGTRLHGRFIGRNERALNSNQRGKNHAAARAREMNLAARMDTTRASAQTDKSA